MPTISGPLSVVTESPAVVSAVWVQAPALRTHGAGAILPQRAAVTLAGSTVSFSCAPGPAVLIWQVGGMEDQVPILVDDAQSQTLAEVVSAAQLAEGSTQDELAALVRQVTEGVAAVTAAASSASWDGDRLTVLGATSPPLTGETGPAGETPYVGANGNWWVGDTDTGVQAQGEKGDPGDGSGDVLWSELNPVLDGKADVGHKHTKADITDLETISILATVDHVVKRTTSGNIRVPFTPNSSTSAASKSYVDSRTPEVRVVSALPASPSPGVVYIVTGA